MSRGVLNCIINNMCGILYTERAQGTVVKALLKRYHAQSSRGTEGFAYLALDKNGKIGEIERATNEKGIIKKLKELNESLTGKILFHHRYPTSTVNVPTSTHPIKVSNESLDYDYYVAHNGIISNDEEQKKIYETLGFEYTTEISNTMTHVGKDGKVFYGETDESFNDSESFAVDLARYIDGDTKKLLSMGSIAFVCIQTDKNGNARKLYFGRNNGNPLIIEESGDLFCIKSEGKGTEIEPDILFWYDMTKPNRKIESEYLEIGQSYRKKNTGFHNRFVPIGADECISPFTKTVWKVDYVGVPYKTTEYITQRLEGELESGYDYRNYSDDFEEFVQGLYDENDEVDEEMRACDDDMEICVSRGHDTKEYEDKMIELKKRKLQIEEQIQTVEYGGGMTNG